MHEYNLRIGKAVVTLAFRCDDEKLAFQEYFQRPSNPGPGDIRLTVKFLNGVSGLTEIPNSLFLTKKMDSKGFSLAGGLIKGRFSPVSGEGELIVQRIITEGSFARIFEQILYQAFWSAVRRKGMDSILLHSSGIVRNDQGYVFTGKSGSGKSTVTLLSEGAKILNDEITIIERYGDRASVSDTPFNGFFKRKEEGSAPLSGIMLLRQAEYHRITRTKAAESVKTLSREIIPPMGLETPLSPSIYWEMLGFAKKISEIVPLYLMEFLPDPGFWQYIEALEEKA
jgi:hypothetical protein